MRRFAEREPSRPIAVDPAAAHGDVARRREERRSRPRPGRPPGRNRPSPGRGRWRASAKRRGETERGEKKLYACRKSMIARCRATDSAPCSRSRDSTGRSPPFSWKRWSRFRPSPGRGGRARRIRGGRGSAPAVGRASRFRSRPGGATSSRGAAGLAVVLSTHADTVPPFFPPRRSGDELCRRGERATRRGASPP